MQKLKFLGLAFALGASLTSAQAASLNNATGLAAPEKTVDFESVALTINQTVTTQFASEGVVFSTAFANPNQGAFSHISGNRLGNFNSGATQNGLFTATFDSLQKEVAFAIASQVGTATFRALLNGTEIESFTGATSAADTVNFFGFTGIVFNQITISMVSPDNTFLIDNLQSVAAVPEPEIWAMLLAGMGLVGVAGRSRRKQPGASNSVA